MYVDGGVSQSERQRARHPGLTLRLGSIIQHHHHAFTVPNPYGSSRKVFRRPLLRFVHRLSQLILAYFL